MYLYTTAIDVYADGANDNNDMAWKCLDGRAQ